MSGPRKTCRPHHGDYAAGCPLCYLARTSEPHARLWGEPWPPPDLPPGVEVRKPELPAARPAAPPPPPCAHAGADLTGVEREARGLSHSRAWRFCLNPDAPLGPVVCPCNGCNPACPGYSAAR